MICYIHLYTVSIHIILYLYNIYHNIHIPSRNVLHHHQVQTAVEAAKAKRPWLGGSFSAQRLDVSKYHQVWTFEMQRHRRCVIRSDRTGERFAWQSQLTQSYISYYDKIWPESFWTTFLPTDVLELFDPPKSEQLSTGRWDCDDLAFETARRQVVQDEFCMFVLGQVVCKWFLGWFWSVVEAWSPFHTSQSSQRRVQFDHRLRRVSTHFSSRPGRQAIQHQRFGGAPFVSNHGEKLNQARIPIRSQWTI